MECDTIIVFKMSLMLGRHFELRVVAHQKKVGAPFRDLR